MKKEDFIGQISHWDSHRPLLWAALEATEGPVIELGMGPGSTQQLHDYCKERNRMLFSYETDKEYFDRYSHLASDTHKLVYVGHNWQIMQEAHRGEIGVLFSDEAPGEMRKYNISMFCNLAKVVVVHDSEKESDHGYKLSLIDPLFKFSKTDKSFVANTTAFSNFIDVREWQS